MEKVSTHYIHLVDDLSPPVTPLKLCVRPLGWDCVPPWIQALAQALAVALGEADLDLLEESTRCFSRRRASAA